MTEKRKAWDVRHDELHKEAMIMFNGCTKTTERFLSTARADLEEKTPSELAHESKEGLSKALQCLGNIKTRVFA